MSTYERGLSGGTSGKESVYQCRRREGLGFNPWVGRSPGEGNSKPLHYSCLENPMDRGAWWATVHGVAKSDMTECTHMHTHIHNTHKHPPTHTHTPRREVAGPYSRYKINSEKLPKYILKWWYCFRFLSADYKTFSSSKPSLTVGMVSLLKF